MRRIFYLTCVLIAFGSLYPFHFEMRAFPGGLPGKFLASLHVPIDRSYLKDVLVNLLVYIPVGFFFVLDTRQGRSKWTRVAQTALAGMVLSACMESLQYLFPPRDPSIPDMVNNTISAGIGGALGLLFAARARQTLGRLEAAFGHPSSALFLLLVWGAAWFCPGDWGRIGAISRLRTMLADPSLHPLLVFVAAAQWIAIGALVRSVVGRAQARSAFAGVALLTFGRVLIPGQPLYAWEWIGMAIAVVAWSVPEIARRLSAGRVAVLICLALMVEELRPWHFAAIAGTFDWMPFRSMLDHTDWSAALLVLFRKCAVYGTAVWSLVRLRLGALGSSIVIATLLALGETAQLYLPGRTAESTDIVLALILGAVMYRLEGRFGTSLDEEPETSGHSERPPRETGHAHRNATARRVPSAPPGTTQVPKIWTGGRRRNF
jgi:VanZ family protein